MSAHSVHLAPAFARSLFQADTAFDTGMASSTQKDLFLMLEEQTTLYGPGALMPSRDGAPRWTLSGGTAASGHCACGRARRPGGPRCPAGLWTAAAPSPAATPAPARVNAGKPVCIE